MQPELRTFDPDDLDAVVDLSLRAWEPHFTEFPGHFGEDLARALHPDWRTDQAKVVTDGCTNPDHLVTVAVVDGVVVGFGVVQLDDATSTGELYLLAVDPEYQGQRIGAALNSWALEVMRAAGMRIARVGTGGDPSHAPARRSYERAGYTAIPVIQYHQVLGE